MAKRRRRKITIKNSSLFAFLALVSLFLLEENSAYQHQNPYRYNNNYQQAYNQQQKHHYVINHQTSSLGAFGGGGGGSLGREEKSPTQLRSGLPTSSSFSVGQQSFQEAPTQTQQPVSSSSSSSNHQTTAQHHQAPSQQHHHYPTNGPILPTAHLCSNLPNHLARQLKLCKLISHSPSADDVVSLGASKGLAECRSQFKNDRWNCTHTSGDHQLLTSELTQSIGNPESGFIHAIAAAGIVHSIATACSTGNLGDCACDKSRVGTLNPPMKQNEQPTHWRWGGCSNNIRHGMMFAKHLVELLDAVHQHARLMQLQQLQLQLHHNHNHHQHQYQQHQYRHQRHHNHQLGKRSAAILVGRDRLFNQRPPEAMAQLPATATDQLYPASVAQRDFCQQNQNISQAKHHELIKSLLSKNSLEKHQEFRLAMNMHNNKVGRMAVARNMELHCRCHGLSGSCSLKTCWQILPSFQVIGTYLRKKYDSSVHLPKVVNLNKLLPMMDRQEISAILSSQESDGEEGGNSGSSSSLSSASPLAEPPVSSSSSGSSATDFVVQDNLQQQHHQPAHHESPKYAALVHNQDDDGDSHNEQTDPESSPPQVPSITTTLAPANEPAPSVNSNPNQTVTASNEQLGLLESHEQQILTAAAAGSTMATTIQPVVIPINLEPLGQQQYQALLRELKLCNNTMSMQGAGGSSSSHLQTRDLQYHLTRKNHHRERHHQQQQLLNGQQSKQANQQLSHLLPSDDKDKLIHLHESPKYCEANLRHGFMGIQSRVCSIEVNAPDNCDKLCCGRGYRTLIVDTSRSCNCEFEYCCTIRCQRCTQQTRVQVCN